MCRLVPTSPDTLSVRRQFALALLDTSATFGPSFAATALIPLMSAAAGAGPVGAPQLPPEILGVHVPDQIRAATADLMPRAPEAARLARERVLPQLLAAVLPGAGQGMLGQYIRAEFTAADTPVGRWVLEAPLVSEQRAAAETACTAPSTVWLVCGQAHPALTVFESTGPGGLAKSSPHRKRLQRRLTPYSTYHSLPPAARA